MCAGIRRPTTAKPLDPFAASLTFVLCVVWGFNQVVVKSALADVGPVAQTGVRAAIGVVCVSPMRSPPRGEFRPRRTFRRRPPRRALFTVEFVALYELLRWTTASRATVFIYAAPFFVALGAVFVLEDERLRPVQWAGLALAFGGVALAMLGRTPAGASPATRWRCGGGAVGRHDPGDQGDAAQARRPGQGAVLPDRGRGALAPLVAYALGERVPGHLSSTTIALLLWQGVAVVGVSYSLWFWVLKRYAAPQLSAFTFVSPLVGVFAGWLVFGDRITPTFSAAIALVLAGLALVNWPRPRTRKTE